MSEEVTESNPYVQRFATASLALGIISIVLSLFWVGMVCAVGGIALGIIALCKNEGKRSHAIAGIVTSCIGLVIPIILIILVLLGFFVFSVGVMAV